MADATPVKVPKDLLGVSATALEDYVRSRLLQFIRRLGVSLGQLLPGVNPALLDRAVHDTLRSLPLPDYGQVPLERRQLQLVFRHDCLALGCLEPQCPLCQHNCKRRCTLNFCKKYLVNDRLLARCGAQIRIEVIDRATGRLCDTDLSDVVMEVFILNGASYDQRFLDTTRSTSLARADSSNPDSVSALHQDLEACALLANKKGKPLLASLAGGKSSEDGRLLLQAVHGRVVLPDLYVSDSSEALLSGRKPPFRLVVRARHKRGASIAVRPAVSEAFVVATRRVKTSHKADIPSMDDPVAKLMHMGRETCRKLADLQAAAQQASMDLGLEQHLACVDKVGDFKALALRAEGDTTLRQQLQTLLKLPREKWEDCVAQAKGAVFPDSRQRAWFADHGASLGLLYTATLGEVDLKRPEALLQRVVDAASGVSQLQVVPQQQQSAGQRDIVRQLLPQAEECWWSPGHTGWTLFDQSGGQVAPGPGVLSPMAQLVAGPLPATAAAAGGKGLLMTPAPAAAAASPASAGLSAFPGITPQLLQQYAAAAAAAQSSAEALHSNTQTAAGPGGLLSGLPPVPELSLGLSRQQQQLQPPLQQQQQVGSEPQLQHPQAMSAAGLSAAGQAGTSALNPQLEQQQQQQPGSSFSFQHQTSTAAAAQQGTPTQQQQPTTSAAPRGRQASQQRQQQQHTRPSAASSPGRPPAAGAAATTPKTPALPSAFAALAAQPIAGSDASPQGSTPAQIAAGGHTAPAAAAPAAAAAAARGVGRGFDGSGGSRSSGLEPSSRLETSRSSGVSWLPPHALSGRKRSFTAARTSSTGTGPAAGDAGAAAGSSAPPPPAASGAAAVAGSQVSADVERLLNAVGFNPSLPVGGPLREAPSLTAFPSMGLFVDTVSPAAAAGGGTGAALLSASQQRPGSAPNRSASAGLSRLLSLDLASLLRGTSMLPAAPAAAPGAAAAAAAAADAMGAPQGGLPGAAEAEEGGQAGTAGAEGGGVGTAGVDVLQGGMWGVEGVRVGPVALGRRGEGDDGLVPTPHAAAAAEAMMALADPMVLDPADTAAG